MECWLAVATVTGSVTAFVPRPRLRIADKSAGARGGQGSLTRNAAVFHAFAARRRFPGSQFGRLRPRPGKTVTDAFSRFVHSAIPSRGTGAGQAKFSMNAD